MIVFSNLETASHGIPGQKDQKDMFEAALILNDFTMVLALEKCLFVSFLNSKCLEWCPYRCPEADKM